MGDSIMGYVGLGRRSIRGKSANKDGTKLKNPLREEEFEVFAVQVTELRAATQGREDFAVLGQGQLRDLVQLQSQRLEVRPIPVRLAESHQAESAPLFQSRLTS